MKDIRAELITVFGKVQGVFYRKSTQKKAWELGIKGWVRNKENGSVEICAEGSIAEIEQLKAWCKTGPSQAEVKDLIFESTTLRFYKSFEIEYSH